MEHMNRQTISFTVKNYFLISNYLYIYNFQDCSYLSFTFSEVKLYTSLNIKFLVSKISFKEKYHVKEIYMHQDQMKIIFRKIITTK